MSLDDALAQAIASIPGCLAVGYVDTVTGMPLGITGEGSLPRDAVELLAATTSDFFRSPHVVTIDKLLSKAKIDSEDDEDTPFREFIVLSQNLIHLFVRGKRYPDHVLLSVTPSNVNLGLVLHKTHGAVDVIEAAL